MNSVNPFRPTRFEKDNRPLIWLSQRVEKLEQRESFYICGTRGSGKTSLLKSIHWRERLENDSLLSQTHGEFAGCIATYIRVPDFISSSISGVIWEKHFPNADCVHLSARFFTCFIEFAAIEELCEAVYSLRDRELFSYSPDDEEKCVADFARRHQAFANCHSLIEIQERSRALLREMNRAASRGSFDQANFFDETLMGETVRDLCSSLETLLSDYTHPTRGRIYFKICIDDCEALVPWQQVALNTLVRISKSPIYWVLSYVDRAYDATSTMVHGQALTEADRKVELLDTLSSGEFRELCEKVTEMRLHYALDLPTDGQFSLSALLGAPSINEMLMVDANRKYKRSFWNLVESAKKSAYFELIANSDTDELPLYQTYLLEKLYPGADLKRLLSDFGPQFDSLVRRKQVAAFLSMRSEFAMRSAEFVGSNVVIAMCDRCIRDYLEIMGDIYDRAVGRAGRSPTRIFHNANRIPYHLQRDAIKAASRRKFDGIKTNSDSASQEAYKLIECLGSLTSSLQGDHTEESTLRTTERGVFVFDFQTLTGAHAADRANRIKAILTRCELDGLLLPSEKGVETPLSISPSPVGQLSYRLHARFSAHFGFSYRGAYEPIAVPMRQIFEVCADPDSINSAEWAKAVAKLINGSASPEADQGRLDL